MILSGTPACRGFAAHENTGHLRYWSPALLSRGTMAFVASTSGSMSFPVGSDLRICFLDCLDLSQRIFR